MVRWIQEEFEGQTAQWLKEKGQKDKNTIYKTYT
jgi:hypothetical protein